MSELWEKIQASSDERLRIEVPEWGTDDDPMIVYATCCTIQDESRVRKAVQGDGDSPDTWARLVWQKVQNEDGKREFDGVDFALFKRKVPAIVCRKIGLQIYAGRTTVEEAEGN